MRLDLGCGKKKSQGYIGIDITPLPGVDIVFDLEMCGRIPLPFKDNSVDEIRAHHTLEHISPKAIIPLMNECYRILKKDGLFKITVPCAPSISAFADPLHISFWNEETFKHFECPLDVPHFSESFADYGIKCKFKIVKLDATSPEEKYREVVCWYQKLG